MDDLPLLGFQFRQCKLAELLDSHFPDHGLWKGISGGQLAVGWLLYILSEGDHRLSHVEDWAGFRLRSVIQEICFVMGIASNAVQTNPFVKL